MSSGQGWCRFPDGAIRFFVYSGTTDIASPWLYATMSEAWDADWRDWPSSLDAMGAEPVDLFTTYGKGFWWRGTATREHIVTGHSPFGWEDGYGGYVHEACETTDGYPDWVTAATSH